ncbi:MAG: hypothetical protein ACKVVP_12735 [Chloroflexota bacterium]
MKTLEQILDQEGRIYATLPVGPVLRTHDQVGVAYQLWLLVAEEVRQERLHLVLVGDQQITPFTVFARLVQGNELIWINVDDEWKLADPGLFTTFRTRRESSVGVRVQEEAMARRLLAETWNLLGCARSFRH